MLLNILHVLEFSSVHWHYFDLGCRETIRGVFMEFFMAGGAAFVAAIAADRFAMPAIDKLVTERVRLRIGKQTLMYEPSNIEPAPSIVSPERARVSSNK